MFFLELEPENLLVSLDQVRRLLRLEFLLLLFLGSVFAGSTHSVESCECFYLYRGKIVPRFLFGQNDVYLIRESRVINSVVVVV